MKFIQSTLRLNYIFLPKLLNTNSHRYCMKHVLLCSTMPIVKQETIRKIGQLSLVNLDGDYGSSVLKAAITFTERLRDTEIDTDIEPMYSPLEKESVPLRNDCVESTASREEILMNAAIVDEEYFIAPVQTITKTS